MSCFPSFPFSPPQLLCLLGITFSIYLVGAVNIRGFWAGDFVRNDEAPHPLWSVAAGSGGCGFFLFRVDFRFSLCCFGDYLALQSQDFKKKVKDLAIVFILVFK